MANGKCDMCGKNEDLIQTDDGCNCCWWCTLECEECGGTFNRFWVEELNGGYCICDDCQ